MINSAIFSVSFSEKLYATVSVSTKMEKELDIIILICNSQCLVEFEESKLSVNISI